MKLKQFKDKYFFAAVLILCVAGGMLFYFMAYKSMVSKVESIQSENAQIRNHITSLQTYYDNREQNANDTEVMLKEVSVILSDYDTAVLPEDIIMEAVDVDRAANNDNYLEMIFTQIKSEEPEVIYTVPQSTIDKIESEEFKNEIRFKVLNTSYANEVGYFALKDALAEIFVSDYKMNIQSLVYTLDENTGLLKGSINVGYYYVEGLDKEYNLPTLEDYEHGTQNIFTNTSLLLVEDEDAE